MINIDTQAIRNALLRASSISELMRLAAQSTGDELRPEAVYEACLAIQDLIETALDLINPLVQEEARQLHAAVSGEEAR